MPFSEFVSVTSGIRHCDYDVIYVISQSKEFSLDDHVRQDILMNCTIRTWINI